LRNARTATHHAVTQPAPTAANLHPSGDRPDVTEILHVTDDTFEDEVLNSPEPVLVDYWANWCAPCKMIAPLLEEIAEEYAGKIKIAKLDIDQNRAVTERFKVRGIPTLMLFKGGEPEATKVGAVSKSQLTVFIDSNL
jgi:thioredoxin 1